MLNRVALIAQMEQLSDALFADFSHEYEVARATWAAIADDPTFVYKVKELYQQVPWQVPLWSGRLDEAIVIDQSVGAYCGLSVDGSQIYPDRHQGTSCFLINIGSVALSYGAGYVPAYFKTEPFVFAGDWQTDIGLVSHSVGAVPIDYAKEDVVNGVRQEFELKEGLKLYEQYKSQTAGLNKDSEILFLFDGSLIFWHLASKQQELKDHFLGRYMGLLNQWKETNAFFAGYISLPKSKELVSLIRCALCDFDPQSNDAYRVVDHVVDTTIAQFFLTPGTRTIIFKSMSDICDAYPSAVRPYFFYLHVGTEIVRIEVPFWIAQSDELVNRLSALILDQCKKGFGYPVLIAEAHEQAVVKGPDRDFFYHVITKLALDRKRQQLISAKSMKKRGIGI